MRLQRTLPFVALVLVCACGAPEHRPPTCEDGVTNGEETDVDCGSDCEPCDVARGCSVGRDCVSGVCREGSCAAPACTDMVQNGTETGTDCGGGCGGCQGGLSCEGPEDCASGICNSGICASPSCSDGEGNGEESDLDCGGPCTACVVGKGCRQSADCQTGVCSEGVCTAPSCTDGLKNGLETDVDCGGSCAACADGLACSVAANCTSGVCTAGVCAAPTCTDGVKNGAESDGDCGGACARCAIGKSCGGAADCTSGVCTGGTCGAGGCGDGAVQSGEQCDDGNTTANDGCSASCQLEGLTPVLLIPNSGDDSVGMYSPVNGAFLGNFLAPRQTTDPWTFSTPINATEAPNGEIWVTDQVSDNVTRFANDGTHIAQFAGAAQTLNNVRGLGFFGAHAYIANGSGTGNVGILRFDAATGANQGLHFTGSGPWDVLFLSDGRAAVTIDNALWLYAAGGTTRTQLVALSFPQQVAHGPSGNFLVTAFSSNSVTEVTRTGTVVRTQPLSSARGVHLLDNGNWLVTSSSGVYVMNPSTGTTTTIQTGTGYRMIERAGVSKMLPP